MCVMEVRQGQRSATMLQAMAHNAKTVLSDFDMLTPLLAARHLDPETLEALAQARETLEATYASLLECFVATVTSDVRNGHDTLDPNHSHERTTHVSTSDAKLIEDAMRIHAHRAAAYETR